METSLIALGANLPMGGHAPATTLSLAVKSLRRLLGARAQGWRVSPLFRSEAYPDASQPEFINACASFNSEIAPAEQLSVLHRVEQEFGRKRDKRWGARSLDLDLLAVGQAVLPDRKTWQAWGDLDAQSQTMRTPGELILPHPRLHERAFVLAPLAEIAPDWCHPVLDKNVAVLLGELSPKLLKQINIAQGPAPRL